MIVTTVNFNRFWCRNHHTRQSIGFFLTKAHWDAPEVLAQTALDTLKG